MRNPKTRDELYAAATRHSLALNAAEIGSNEHSYHHHMLLAADQSLCAIYARDAGWITSAEEATRKAGTHYAAARLSAAKMSEASLKVAAE